MAYSISTTGTDLITRALRLLHALEAGEAATADDLADGFIVLRQMLDTWSADGSLPPVATELQLRLSAGTGDYTVGPTGTLVATARPTTILTAVLRDDSNSPAVDYGLQELSRERYYGVPVKSQQVRPMGYFFEEAYPNASLRFDCVPDKGYLAVLSVLNPFLIPDEVTDTIALPPGYEEALQYSLAARLAPENPATPMIDLIIARADQCVKTLRARYARIPESAMPSTLVWRPNSGGYYNIFRGP